MDGKLIAIHFRCSY